MEVKYNGKVVKDVPTAFLMAIEESVKEKINDKLKPFEQEIAHHGGTVKITVHSDLKNVTLNVDGVPQELMDRIQSSLA